MGIIVPEEVLAEIAKIESSRKDQQRRARAANEAEKRRLAAIDRLRRERRDELYDCAKRIFKWRLAYLHLPVAKRIGKIGNDRELRLPLYIGKFWRGEPTGPDNVVCWACLCFDGCSPPKSGTPGLWYEEWHKGHCAFEDKICTASELIQAVHPDFLKQAADHLAGPDSWKFILQELKRVAPR